MTVYYVNNTLASASNLNPGTNPLFPWSTISKAASTLVAGDTVVVGPGGTYDERVIPAASGTLSAPIAYTAAAGTKPKARGFTVTNKSYITIQGFELTNLGLSADSSASVIATASTGVKVISNYIHDTSAQAIRCNPNGATAKAVGLIVRGNTMTNIGPKWNGVTGAPGRFPIIELWADESLIEDNNLSHGDDFLDVYGNRNVYRNNVLHDSDQAETADGIRHIDGFQSFCSLNTVAPQAANYFLAEGNVMRNNVGTHTHFGLINSTDSCGGSTTVIVRHNVIESNGSSTYVADTNAGLADHHKVYNNTVRDASRNSHETVNINGCTYGAVINNIFQDAILPTAPAKAYNLDLSGTSRGSHNLGYMTAYPSQVWAAPINTEAGRILNQSPLLDSSLQLGPGSPAIGTAGPLTTVAAGDSGSGTTLVLEDAHFFQDGWAGVEPDQISVGAFSNHAAIVSINYATNTVTLASGLTRNDGDPVYLYANSSGEVLSLDRGAYPYDVTQPPPAPPVAAFSASPLSGEAPLSVAFTDASTGSPTSRAWEFEANGVVNSVATNPTNVYSVEGTYSVKLTVSNAGGSDSETKTGYITVDPPAPPPTPPAAPTASFTGTPLSGVVPLSVAFTDTSTDDPTGWQWDFEGNGSIDSTSRNPVKVYTTPGVYTVSLTASNAGGSDASVIPAYVTALAAPLPPEPEPDAPPVPGNSGTIVTSSIARDAITLSWTKATDDVNEQPELKYEVRLSLSNNIGTVALAERNGVVVKPYLANIQTCRVTGLRVNTVYYFQVIARDCAGNQAAYVMKGQKTLKQNGRP